MTGEALTPLSVSLTHPGRGGGERGQRQEKLWGGINERGRAIAMNFSSGLKCNCNAGISALGSCLAVAVGWFLAVDVQGVKAKVGCAALWGEAGKAEVSGGGFEAGAGGF